VDAFGLLGSATDDRLLRQQQFPLGTRLSQDLLGVDPGVLEDPVLLTHDPTRLREFLWHGLAKLAQQRQQFRPVHHH
jgi:hypothetical protein